MKLTYIYHSCYMVEGKDFDLIFDYFRDTERDGIIHKRLQDSSKKLYVLSSHSHPDHFNSQILTWKINNPNIEYIFSKEILDEGVTRLNDAHYLDKMEEYCADGLSVKAFGSTDIGGSFLVKMDNKTIFHAGDLNNWHWNEESTPQESQEYEVNFLEELELLAQNVTNIDLAMFPIDPNLGKDYMLGAEQFVTRVDTIFFAPMHFHDHYDKATSFRLFASKHGCQLLTPSCKGQNFQLQ